MKATNIFCIVLVLSTLILSIEGSKIRKQLNCNKCKKNMQELQSQDVKVDEAELLDNLLTVCDNVEDHPNPELRDKNTCNGFAELVYTMSNYENLCTLVGLCEDNRDNSILPYKLNLGNPSCDAATCSGLVADAAQKCSAEKECSPECISTFIKSISTCDDCFDK